MRRSALLVSTLLLVTLVASSCPKDQPANDFIHDPLPTPLLSKDVYTTLLRNVPENMEEKVSEFNPGDYPVVIVKGYLGELIRVEIRERYTGTTVDDRRPHITRNVDHIDFTRLAAGDFNVWLYQGDVVVDAFAFKVIR